MEEQKENKNGTGLLENPQHQKTGFDKPQLVQKAVERILENRSAEMVAGYYNSTFTPDGERKVYVPDSRKKFISSVVALKSLLYPELQINEKTKNYLKTFDKKFKEIFEKYAVFKFIEKDANLVLGTVKYIPEIDELIPSKIRKQDDNGINSRWVIGTVKGFYNLRVKNYWDAIVELHDELFAKLNFLISDMNYFK